uniref:MADF domain-containing protein n=1 Tax=Lygus hesperus TaxID=30085 RepID=A0A146LXL7_LYGHE
MDMEMLIQTVQDYPALYDPSHPDYGKKKTSDNLWEKIAEELNYSSGVVVKDHWMRLRNRHRNALRNRKKNQALGQSCSSWIYQSEMEFLLPFMPKSLSSAVESPEENPSDNEDNTSQMDLLSSDHEPEQEDIEFTNPELDSSSAPEIGASFSLQSLKKRKYEASESAFETADQKVIKIDELLRELIAYRNQKTEESNDPLYQFFMSMYQTSKGLPSKYQLRIRKKLFYAVSDAEEEVLSIDSSQVSNPHLSSSNSEAMPSSNRKNSVK